MITLRKWFALRSCFGFSPGRNPRIIFRVVALSFAGGRTAFTSLDLTVNVIQSPVSQLTAMLWGFIVEALAPEACFVTDSHAGVLPARLIVVEKHPE